MKLYVNAYEKLFFLNAAAFVLNSVTSSNSFMSFSIFLCAFGRGAYKNESGSERVMKSAFGEQMF